MKGYFILILGFIAIMLVATFIYYLYVNRAGDDTANMIGGLVLAIIGSIGFVFFGLLKNVETETSEINVKLFVHDSGEVAPFGSYVTGLSDEDIFACLSRFKDGLNAKNKKPYWMARTKLCM